MFNAVFLKKLYLYVDTFGSEIKDSKTRKKTTLKREFRFLLVGLICNYLWLTSIYEKIDFFIIDDIFRVVLPPQLISNKFLYFTVFIFLSSKRVFQYITLSERRILSSVLIISIHLTIACQLDSSSLFTLVLTMILFFIMKSIINRLRFFSVIILSVYLAHNIIIQSFVTNDDMVEFQEIYIILFFTNVGLILTIMFIILIYTNLDFIRLYNNVYERIFLFKLTFDLALYISFIYIFVNYDKQNYLTHFSNLKHIFLFTLFLQYTITYLFVHLRLVIKIKMDDIEKYLFFEKDINYNINSSYYEVQIYKNISFIVNIISHELDFFSFKNLKKIKSILLTIIFFLVLFLINDSR